MTSRSRRSRRTARPGRASADALDWRAGAAIFLVALVVRALHLWQIRRAPFLEILMGDARAYDEWAQRIASGDWFGHDVFYQAPLYPYFLGSIYTFAGRHLLIVRALQAAIGSASCVFLAAAGSRFFSSRRTGIVCGMTLALYAPAIFFDGLIQKSVLDVFLVCAMVWLLARLIDEPSRPRIGIVLGATIGVLSLTRENALVFAAGILGWLWSVRNRERLNERLPQRTGRRRDQSGISGSSASFASSAAIVPRVSGSRNAGAFAIGLALVLLPVGIRNQVAGGAFHLTTAQFGPNFYIGNNPRATGTYMSLRPGRGAPEYEQQDATELAELATGRRLTPSEVSDYWTAEALAFIRAQPAAWLKLLGRKFVLVWNAGEMLDTESEATYAEWSLPLRILGSIGHFGVLVPLAVLGVYASWPRRSRLTVLYVLVGSYVASVVLFFVFARYRYPLVPFVILFAAAGVTLAPRAFVESSRARTAAALAACGAAAVFVNWPMLNATLMQAITEANLGAALYEAGRHDEAAAHYRRAVDLRPEYAPAHNGLGAALRAQGHADEAIDRYEQALRLNPTYAAARTNLANALHARANARASGGALDAAIVDLRQAAELKPDDPTTHYDLATTLLEARQWDAAIGELRTTIALAPNSVEAHNNLGIALGSQGKLDDAIEEFRTALKIQPAFSEAKNNLEMAQRRRQNAQRRR